MQFPILEISPDVASSLLTVLSFLFSLLTSLMAGGAVLMLVAQKRGAGSIELRWNDLSHRIAIWVLNLTLGGVTLFGISLWMVFIFVHPKAAAYLHNIFLGPLLAGCVLMTGGVVLLSAYVFGWSRWRGYSWVQFSLGVGAASCFWLAAAIVVSLKSFTLTSGGWPSSLVLWRAVFNPSILPSYLLWSSVAIVLAGSAGLIYAICQRDNLWREAVIQGAGTITAAAALAGSVACLVWLIVLSFAGNLDGMGEGIPPIYFGAGVVVIAVELSTLLILTAVRRPESFGNVLCGIAVVSAITLVAGIQAVQDKSRGPFLIQNYMYRNEILVSEVDRLKENGLWKPIKWKPEKEEHPRSDVLGSYNFQVQCRACHSAWSTAGSSSGLPAFKFEGDALLFLDQISSRHPFFPVFAGSIQEKRAVALYIEGLVKKSGVSLASRPADTFPQSQKNPNLGVESPSSGPLPVPPRTGESSKKEKEIKDIPRKQESSPQGDRVKAAPVGSDGFPLQTPSPEGEEKGNAQKSGVQGSLPPGNDTQGGGRQDGSPDKSSLPAGKGPTGPSAPKANGSESGAGGQKQ